MVVLKSYISVLFLIYVCCANETNDKAIVDYLEKNTFNQGKAEYVFVLDRSGSVGATNFELQRGFVESFLTHVIVDVNASRVAVISYSETAECHIDYLREPKNKCILSQELQDVVYNNSGATNTAEALEKAQMVFQNARPNIKKVLILISDGVANKGGDPLTYADLLKAMDVEIFCFGIGRFIRPALARLATSEQHVYSCSHFKDFRNLVRRIRGDSHETKWSVESFIPKCDHLCDSLYRGQPYDPGCCDHNAKCSCALQSGMYTCVCLPGYYGLSGLPGHCRACPKGTYKSKMEPTSKCTHCPSGSTTKHEASTGMVNCICKEGYEGDPSNGIPCMVKKCPPLQNPTHGYLFGDCDFTYQSECYFACDEGYELVNTESHIRTCRSNKEWSGNAAICRQIRCPTPQIPLYGSMSCDEDLVVGKECRFSCGTGYIMDGSPERECFSNAKWSGIEVNCIPVECGLPPLLKHGDVGCKTFQKMTFAEVCSFICRQGFERVGPAYLICNESGRILSAFEYTEVTPYCKDVTPPEITCPGLVTTNTLKGENYAMVDISIPECADNSGIQPKLRTQPEHVTFPRDYAIGKHTVRFIAVDNSGLESFCDVNIIVYDDEPPAVVRCPSKVNATSDGIQKEVFWDEPLFEDNSKEPVTIIKSHFSGDKFGPGQHIITYQAFDAEKNEARCVFEVVVNRNTCPYHPPPTNGAFSCVDYWYGQICQAYCSEMHDFVETPADYYLCTSNSTWETVPSDMTVPWPDCSRPAIPVKIKKKLKGFYYQGNCNDPEVQIQIKKMFLTNLESGFEQAALCVSKGRCNLQSVKLMCGKTDDEWGNSKNRRRRDVWQHAEREELELEFEIIIDVDREFNDTEEVLQQFLETIQNLKWDTEDFELHTTADPSFTASSTDSDEPPRYQLNFENETYAGSVAFTDDSTELFCRPGSVLNDNRCVLCSPGTYYDVPAQMCVDCSPGQYQEDEGQMACEWCPIGTSTEKKRTRHLDECKRICQPGTYSANGLETCIACPLGTYQEFVGQMSCHTCPDGKTTSGVRSTSMSDCKNICESGSYSKTGLQPCDLCHKGFYQSLPGQMLCNECPTNFSTAGKGSRYESECLDLDPCSNETACMNEGTCERVGRTAKCVCRKGFEGVRCEKDIDECQQTPCHNSGTCVNEDGTYHCICISGFTGKICELEMDECSSSPCLNNGTCMDKVNGYVCICPPSYEGRDCEIAREVCFHNVACVNGECELKTQANRCVCLPGFQGVDCSIEVDECENVTCLNNGSCVDGIASFKCVCEAGYTGNFCEVDINYCETNNCSAASVCFDLVGTYECVCSPGYSGTFCETKLDSDFILNFPDSSSTIANMATLTLQSELADVTVSMWVQTTDVEHSGTPLSYAVASAGSSVVDNALTISDCNDVRIYVNNQPLITDVQVADGQWHHLAFTWSSTDFGTWNFYKDGTLQSNGTNLKSADVIQKGGTIVIGQEQDSVGGSFSPYETFTGNITRVNIWSSSFSKSNIRRLCSLDDDIPGKVVAWPDFLQSIKGHVNILNDERPSVNIESSDDL